MKKFALKIWKNDKVQIALLALATTIMFLGMFVAVFAAAFPKDPEMEKHYAAIEEIQVERAEYYKSLEEEQIGCQNWN